MPDIKRIEYIDYLKVWAIYIMVLGHVMANYGANVDFPHIGIAPYNMPLFAILSGLFFSAKADAISFVRKKFIQIALPLLVWCFIQVVLIGGFQDVYHLLSTGQKIHPIGLCKWWAIFYFTHLINWAWWFLRALFFSFIYSYFSIRLCKRNVVMGVCLSVLLLYTLSLTGVIPNMWMRHSTFLYPFFCVGILLKEYKNFIFHHNKTFLAISFVVYSICICFWQDHDGFYYMNTSMLAPEGNAGITGVMVLWKTIYRFITGTSGSVILILLGRRIKNNLPSTGYLLSIGRNTLGIYILHTYTFQILPPPSSHSICDDKIISFLVCLFISALIVVTSSLIVDITNKSRGLRLFLWGKAL